MISHSRWLAASALVAFVTVASSGVSAAQTQVATDARFEKLAKDLYPKAKQEGALVVYTIWDVEHIKSILDVFNKRFPGINTTYWQGTRSEIITRTLTEFQGDQKTADVILSEGAPVVLRAAGAIEPYNTVQASSLILHDPILPTVSLQIVALAYNTKKLKKEDLPKSWEDVINPKYKGIVALDDPMRAGPLSGMLAGLKEYWKNDAKWTNYIKGLKALNVTVHKSTSAMFRLLISGEYSIAMPALLHDVIEEKEKGSPVDFVKSAAPIISAQQLGIYGKAPHINGAKLFAEWMVSPEGQMAVSAVGREVSRKGIKSKASIEYAWGPNAKPIPSVNKTFSEDPRKWLDANVKPVWEN
ncbi:MAG TPA: extracellular solute-binding protein [Terriglobales bacterium]|nr:extracellular solute-binding protein [Terriglobales bacterium]